ncbi:hypothetical protein [Dactylosporangium sp. NPDC005555]
MTDMNLRFDSPLAFDKRSVELLMMRIDDGVREPAATPLAR